MTDPESGEVVCSICGLVVQEKMEDTKLQYYEKGIDTRGKEPSSLLIMIWVFQQSLGN